MVQVLYYDVYFCIGWFAAMCAVKGVRNRYQWPLTPAPTWLGVILPWAVIQPIRIHLGARATARGRSPRQRHRCRAC